MAKSLEITTNGIGIKYIKKDKHYYLFRGSAHIQVNGQYISGFKTQQEASTFAYSLKHSYGNQYIQ